MSVSFQRISKLLSLCSVSLCLSLAATLTGCSGSTEVVVKVSDEEGAPIAGVAISQVGGSELGTTDAEGLATIVPKVGDDEVEIRLSVSDNTLEVLNPYSITRHHLNSRRRIIRLRQKSDVDMGLTASIEIVSNPDGATVRLRGSLLGTTPLHQTDLVTGMARIELELEGYQAHLIDMVLVAGDNAPISVDLVSLDLADAGDDSLTDETTDPSTDPGNGTSDTPVEEDPVRDTPPINTAEVDALKRDIARHLQTQSWIEAEAAVNRLAAIDPGEANLSRWRQAITTGKQDDERRMRISILRSSIPSRLANQDWAGAQREAKELLRYQPNDMLANQWLRESEAGLNAPKEDPSPPKDDPNPDRDISNLLQRYEDTLEALDIGGYSKLWKEIPKNHREGVERGFSQMTALQLNLSDINIQRSGDSASVSFTESRTISLRAGSDQSFNRRVTLTLVREGGSWLIEKLEGR